MYWRYLGAALESLKRFAYSVWILDPPDGSIELANELYVHVLIKIITNIVTLTTRRYDYQEPQCGAESRSKSTLEFIR